MVFLNTERRTVSGKHFQRAMHCHKILLKSLERMLLDELLEQINGDVFCKLAGRNNRFTMDDG